MFYFISENDQYINNTLDVTFTPQANAIHNYIKISNVSNNTSLKGTNNNNYHDKQITIQITNVNDVLKTQKTTSSLSNITEKPKHNEDKFTSSLNLLNEKYLHNIKYNAYNVTSNNSLPEVIKISIMRHNKRKKRSFEPIFNSSVQVSW